MSPVFGKEAENKKKSDISEERKQMKEMASLPESKNFPGKLRFKYRKVNDKSWSGKYHCATILPTFLWTSYSRSYTDIQLKFLLLEIDCYDWYCKNLAYQTKSRIKYLSKMQIIHKNVLLNQM